MTDARTPGSDHRPDVEILPPDRGRTRSGRAQSRIWISIDTSRGQGRSPGLFGIILTILVVTFVTAMVLMVLLGALLIWVPVAAVLLAAVLIGGLLRRRFRRRGPRSNDPVDQSMRGPDNLP